MDLNALRREIEDLEWDRTLGEEANLGARARALDLAALIDQLAREPGATQEILRLRRRAESLRDRLLTVNRRLFARLREMIQTERITPRELRAQFDRFTTYTAEQIGQVHVGFDGLDLLLDGIFEVDGVPTPMRMPLPEMVYYEPTPARVILDLVDHAGVGPGDVFYDLGSGLGRVVTLVKLITGITAKGIEYQPEYCAYARRCAAALNVANVEFINADARSGDFSDGTLFFLFTPFKGAMLQSVIETLRREALRHRLTICTFGPCTRDVITRPWLRAVDPVVDNDYRLAVFHSL